MHPDEITIVREICRRIDATSDAERAWHIVSNIDETGVFEQRNDMDPVQQAGTNSTTPRPSDRIWGMVRPEDSTTVRIMLCQTSG